MSKNDLTIVIVSYNSQYWLKKTLVSLKTHYLDSTKRRVTVVVVDNHSEDDTVEVLKEQFKWVELKVLPENVGFARGNNVALQAADSTYVMLLNSDVELTAESNLDPLIDMFESDSRLGIVTPKLVLTTGELDMPDLFL